MKALKSACFACLIFLSACNPMKYMAVPIDYPPKLSFKPDSTVILLINKVDFSKKNYTERKLRALKAGAFASIRYAQTQLTLLPHVNVINTVDSAAFNVNTDSIKFLASKYHAGYVLALQRFGADIDLSEVQSSTAYYSSTVEVNFTLYEDNGIYFKKLNGVTNEAQSEGPYLGLIASLFIHPTIGGNKESIKAAAEHATQIALQDYLPYTISHNRPLYNDDILKPAVKEILAGNFDKAYNLSAPFLQHNDLLIASKAAYNLAVVYEAQGDIDLAINMAQLSLDKKKNLYASAILDDLKLE